MIRGERVKPLRLVVPVVAILAAVVLFVGIGFVSYRGFVGGPQATTFGACDAGIVGEAGLADRQAGTRAADLSEEQLRNAATIIGVARDLGTPPRA